MAGARFPGELWRRLGDEARAEVIRDLVEDGIIQNEHQLEVRDDVARPKLPPALNEAFAARRAARDDDDLEECYVACEERAEAKYFQCIEHVGDEDICDLRAVRVYELCALRCG